MIIKKEGIINEIIYEHTTYHSGKYRLYPTISDLNELLDKIIDSKSTTNYLRITPFYVNENAGMQIEFEEYMFYLECRNQFDENELENHIMDNLDTFYENISVDLFKMGKILYPLCKYNDVEKFNLALVRYRECLNEFLPRILEWNMVYITLHGEDLAFGFFCFEIHSD